MPVGSDNSSFLKSSGKSPQLQPKTWHPDNKEPRKHRNLWRTLSVPQGPFSRFFGCESDSIFSLGGFLTDANVTGGKKSTVFVPPGIG